MWSQEEMQKELHELHEYRAWIDRRIDALKILLEPPPEIGVSLPKRTTRVMRGGRLKEMADAIFPFLKVNGQPARREEILEHLEKTGVEVTGEDYKKKLALVSSALSKDPRFRSMGRSTGRWDIDRDHMKRTLMVQDRQETQSGYHAPSSDSPIYEQVEKPEAIGSYEPSDADDLPW